MAEIAVADIVEELVFCGDGGWGTVVFNFAPNVSMYAAGKAALPSFTRSMAAAYGPYGIRVNALAPGPSTPT